MDAAAEGSSRMAKFACRICGKGFQSETAVRSHEADKHGDRDWKRCFYMFLFICHMVARNCHCVHDNLEKNGKVLSRWIWILQRNFTLGCLRGATLFLVQCGI